MKTIRELDCDKCYFPCKCRECKGVGVPLDDIILHCGTTICTYDKNICCNNFYSYKLYSDPNYIFGVHGHYNHETGKVEQATINI